jgi:hypothetical protein
VTENSKKAPFFGIFGRKSRPIAIAADLGTTNALLDRIAAAQERQAHAFELFLAAAFDLEVDAELPVPDAREAMLDDERLAVIESLERDGIEIPVEIYRGLGIDPPTKADKGEPVDVDTEEPPQPASDEDEGAQVARRKSDD